MANKSDATLYVSSRTFAGCWMAAFMAHSICASFLFGLTGLYYFMCHPLLTYYNKLLHSSLGFRLRVVGFGFTLIGIGHVLEMAKMVRESIRMGEWAFEAAPDPSRLHPAELHVPASVTSAGRTEDSSSTTGVVAKSPSTASPWRRVVRTLKMWKTRVFDRRHGLLGVENERLYDVYAVRELLEAASQTLQMYNCSQLIAQPWINNMFLVLMVANCWSTPLLQHVLHRSPEALRVLCLTTDFVLDAGLNMLIPLVIFVPFWQSFNNQLYQFKLDDMIDPQFFVNMIRENRMVFAMSAIDFISKLIPQHGLLKELKAIKRLIAKQPSFSMAGSDDTKAQEMYTKSTAEPPQSKVGISKMRRLLQGIFIIWGIVILVIHVRAATMAQQDHVGACQQPLRPWFATRFACSSFEFNCYTMGQVDTVRGEDLLGLDSNSLAALVISHCPALVMPPEIQRFTNLLRLLVYNSTVVSWEREAALTNAVHKELSCILIVRVNMTGLPPGLLEPLPATLQDIQISKSNLSSLPSDLHLHWSARSVVFLEYCEFHEFPPALLQLEVDTLSLIGNHLEAPMPSFKSYPYAFLSFAVSGNSNFTAWPDAGAIGDLSRLRILSFEDTGVTELPAWMLTDAFRSQTQVFAAGTPFCEDSAKAATFPVACTQRDPLRNGRYPLDITTRRMALPS
ncbi:TPA: hypothetical protein N0F65_011688 [Lagenidium giganteum]|uniref:Leucine-rich repeat domain, L domain-like n=1 Tax=Lagenidium giganteum TaxID=4803 RepID=A0AAV2YVQ4_9STRA|nr:TPA: hypothetical protein N0F65_011688 [Lagenidium giganteum]